MPDVKRGPHVKRAPLLAAALLCAGCSSRPAPLTSELSMGDRMHERQLLFGFHGVEGQTRWTGRVFGVLLQPPAGSERSGGHLRLRFFIPGEHVEQLGGLTLSAEIDGYLMPEQRIAEGGMHEYRHTVPSELLETNVLPVKFVFDRALPPGKSDARELGAVAVEAGLFPGP